MQASLTRCRTQLDHSLLFIWIDRAPLLFFSYCFLVSKIMGSIYFVIPKSFAKPYRMVARIRTILFWSHTIGMSKWILRYKTKHTEFNENSLSLQFSCESAWFFGARPWEMIFWFSISSHTRLKKELFVLVPKHEIERKILVLVSKMIFPFKFPNERSCIILRKIRKLTTPSLENISLVARNKSDSR